MENVNKEKREVGLDVTFSLITIVVALLLMFLMWSYYSQRRFNEDDLGRMASYLSGKDAINCGSNSDYDDFWYPSMADQCAAAAFKAGKPFRVHGCYARTDTAGCYWMAGTPKNQVYFIYYSLITLQDPIINIMVAPCDAPEIVIKHEIETVQCPSMPLDPFHIDY